MPISSSQSAKSVTSVDYSLAVIGGGIAGLAAAYEALRIAKKGRGQHTKSGQNGEDASPHIALFEAEPRLGGKITTLRREGFVVEGGPDTFLATKPWAVELCRELGIADRLRGTNPHRKATYVLHRGRLEPLPDGLTMMIPTRFAPMLRTRLLTWPQKARMGLDFFLPPRRDDGDESLGAFVTRRLGRGAYEGLIEPLLSGIYAGDGDQLSLPATFPYLRDLEQKYGGLIKGALAMRRKMGKRAPGTRSAFLTPETGLAEIVEALEAALRAGGVALHTATPVQALIPTADGFRLTTPRGEYHAQKVVVATPAYAAARLVEPFAPDAAAALRGIPYATTATVSLAYRETDLPRPLDGYGYVIPRREGREALACTWTSTKFPHRAPKGYALLRVFVGRAGQEAAIAWEPAALEAIARRELAQTLGITAELLFAEVFIWPQAMPQYTLGHLARVQAAEAALSPWPNLALAGNAYRGIGIPDCIRSGREAIRKLVDVQP